ncbi:carboxypeptidase-like regulatory domain-containing protein [Sediminibacterium sp.]|uniref:carboxypeptidase-like regulatory domain-containing protein n=1 Tax=Sediminibacterium sp. TaxID=1917865 RepID=UPI0025F119AC|nr:carboxypeptidase-like regulatory domain-containing protein [Sediminibacterium sp.]MBW0176284.1 carboxypeptidase-like regulatory domain-containing protein [Sediminibacterium sp.]
MPIRTNSYSLSLKKGCQQTWSAMSDKQDGKFCMQCAKLVIDFTELSDQEIIQLLSQNTRNVCARVTPEQLNRDLRTHTPKAKRTRLAIFTGIFTMLTVENASAALHKSSVNTTLYHVEEPSSRLHVKSDVNAGPPTIDSTQNIIQGKVTGANTKLPIAYATVMIKNTNVGVLTDTMGLFTIIVPEKLKAKQIELVVSSVGYVQVETKIDPKRMYEKGELIFLQPNEELLGEVIIIPKRKKWWQFWK